LFIPVAIKHYRDAQFYIAEAEVPAPAEKAYETALSMTEERPDLQILKKDDSKLFLEVTDGRQKGSFKAKPIDDKSAEIVVRANVPKEEEKREELQQELALRFVDRLCTRLQVKCTVVEQ
jgi:hypothetical protein